MTSRLSHVSIDAHDAYAQSVWWGAVLDLHEDPEDPNTPGDEECMIFSPDGRTRVLFIQVPEAKDLKNRLHFDLRPVDLTREEEVQRLLDLGATTLADHRRPDGTGWLTMSDPEGNEFCVLRGDPRDHRSVRAPGGLTRRARETLRSGEDDLIDSTDVQTGRRTAYRVRVIPVSEVWDERTRRSAVTPSKSR